MNSYALTEMLGHLRSIGQQDVDPSLTGRGRGELDAEASAITARITEALDAAQRDLDAARETNRRLNRRIGELEHKLVRSDNEASGGWRRAAIDRQQTIVAERAAHAATHDRLRCADGAMGWCAALVEMHASECHQDVRDAAVGLRTEQLAIDAHCAALAAPPQGEEGQ